VVGFLGLANGFSESELEDAVAIEDIATAMEGVRRMMY